MVLRIPSRQEVRMLAEKRKTCGSTTRLPRATGHSGIAVAGLALFTVLVWSSAFPAIKIALTSYTPAELACLRYLVASVALLACTGGRISPLPQKRDILRFLVCGVLGISLYNIALAFGEKTVPAGVASLLVSTTPLFAAGLAHLFLKDRLTTLGWLGLAVSLAGVVMISVSQGSVARMDSGALALVGAAALQALSIVLQKPLFSRYSALEVTAYTIWGATVALAGFFPSLAAATLRSSLSATLAVLYLGAVPAALGILAWSFILSRIPAARAASLLYVVPVAALAVSWLWLGEVPAVISILGGALSISGTLLVARQKGVKSPSQVMIEPARKVERLSNGELPCANDCKRMVSDRAIKSASNF